MLDTELDLRHLSDASVEVQLPKLFVYDDSRYFSELLTPLLPRSLRAVWLQHALENQHIKCDFS
jgi:hypothetical protein